MGKKVKKGKEPLFTKKQLKKHFTTPVPIHVQPEEETVCSTYISINADKKGFKTVYNSSSNDKMRMSRADLVGFIENIHRGNHYPALRTHLDD